MYWLIYRISQNSSNNDKAQLYPLLLSIKQNYFYNQVQNYALKFIYQIMSQDQEEFNRAVQQLKIRVKDDPADREQLNKILFQILCYPTTKAAYEHHRASNSGTLDLLSTQKQLQNQIRNNETSALQICQCCGLMIKNEPLPYCVAFKKMKIGLGVRLFFENYLFNFGIFVLMFLVYGIYAIVTNIISAEMDPTKTILCFFNDEEESENQCNIALLGGGSKVIEGNPEKDQFSLIQSWIAFGFVIIWGLLIMIRRYFEKRFIVHMETERISASSFTLMITQFPKFYVSRQYQQNLKEINNIFRRYGEEVQSKFSYEVIKYNIAKPLYLDLKEKKKQTKEKQKQLDARQQIFRNWLRYRKKSVDFPIPYELRAKEYDKYVEFYTEKYDTKEEREYNLDETNLMFVTMRSSSAMEQIVRNNPIPSISNFWNCCSKSIKFPIKNVKIQKAPEPQEIKFERVGFPFRSTIIRKVIIWLVTLALIGISIGVSVGIGYINVEEEDKKQQISIGISLVVTLINFLIQLSIMYLTYFENQHISSSEQAQVALKIGIGQIANSIGVPLVVAAVAASDSRIADKKWLTVGGLVNDVFLISLFSLAVPFGRFLDPWEIFLKLLRKIKLMPSQKLKMNGQQELNKFFGNYQFDIGYEYAYLIKTAVFTSFFACLQPIIILFSASGLLIYYLADKRNLLRHFQRPTFHSSTINNHVDLFLAICPVVFGFGHLLVNNFLIGQFQNRNNSTQLVNWLIVIAGAVFIVLILTNIFYCCITKPEHPQWDYKEKAAVIPTDYDRMNPETRQKAIFDFGEQLRQLQEKQLEQQQQRPENLHLQIFSLENTVRRNNQGHLKKQFTASSFDPFKYSKLYSQNIHNQGGPSYNENIYEYENYIRNSNKVGSANQLNNYRDI